jgi:hypothetical protein
MLIFLKESKNLVTILLLSFCIHCLSTILPQVWLLLLLLFCLKWLPVMLQVEHPDAVSILCINLFVPGMVDLPVIPASRRQRQEDHHAFQASLGYIARPCRSQ